MLAIADPKFPAPITPTGLSDKFLEVIAGEAVVIVVQHVEIARDDVALFVFEKGSIQVEDAHVVKTMLDHFVRLAFEMCGIVDFALILHLVDFLSYAFKGLAESGIVNFHFLFRESKESEEVKFRVPF